MADVLIVDDEPSVVAVLSSAVQDEGYSVAAAGDGQSALALLDSGLRPSLIITDQMMPRLTGAELAATIQERGEHDPAVVVMSANHIALDGIHGVAATLPKPFDLETVAALLDRYCQQPEELSRPTSE